ncbi:MAG: hypothetical protein HN742_04700 [Lentisphaerae bacterium]|nr:hypothetical protein [Lentisphaerota bacterium]MBT4815412.1 hypothetical protein [Lentisphaerota bacterium]MBT5612660.1 hypothetical protein [Lentisphaerota bacterium]MBT7053684.1 hypothetical protein [Lentisphaerota bacterium]MBT7841145.1 hypothetical protein [Lentisphaerota bacterium]
MSTQEEIQTEEVRVLRELASEVAEIAALPVNSEKRELWRRLNNLEDVRPLVYSRFMPEVWEEFLPDDQLLTLESRKARDYERALRRKIWAFHHLKDDRIIDPIVHYRQVFHWSGGIRPELTRPDESRGAWKPKPVIIEKSDIEKITPYEISLNETATTAAREEAEHIFGDILTVLPERVNVHGNNLGDTACNLRGIEEFFMDMVLDPEWCHAFIGQLAEIQAGKNRRLEELGVLRPKTDEESVSNNGIGPIDQMPTVGAGKPLELGHIWGGCMAQIFEAVSLDMHEEFIFQYERPLLDPYGLTSLSCCERIDTKWESVVKTPHLRWISVSEWNDLRRTSELLGRSYVHSFKPTGLHQGAATWHPSCEEAYLRDAVSQCSANVTCLINYIGGTLHGQAQRVIDWTDIAMRVVREYE